MTTPLEKREETWVEIGPEDLASAREKRDTVEVGGVELSLFPERMSSRAPDEFEEERTTVWSFPDRGEWATHRGNYRGNWSPYIPRNLLVKFTEPGDLVLDQMCGSGTTLIEAKLLQRDCIGIDVNEDAVLLAQSRLEFDEGWFNDESKVPEIRTFVGDARDLTPLPDESVDLVATHPPYANIINYTRKETDDDISAFAFPEFLNAIAQIATEAFRVLKQDHYCAILIGDTRKKKHYVPVSVGVLDRFLQAGFVLKEDVVKIQHKMKGTRERWSGTYDFQLIAHEHLYIFRKPSEASTNAFKWSRVWW